MEQPGIWEFLVNDFFHHAGLWELGLQDWEFNRMIEEVEDIGKVDKSGLSEVCCLYGLGLDGLVLDGAEGIPVGMLTGLEL